MVGVYPEWGRAGLLMTYPATSWTAFAMRAPMSAKSFRTRPGEEGQQHAGVMLGAWWHGTDGDRRVILASATLSRKTSRRVVNLEFPGVPEQTWRLDLPSDPDPTPGYLPWRFPSSTSAPKIEMNFRLSADV
jgi:hypothetical protein